MRTDRTILLTLLLTLSLAASEVRAQALKSGELRINQKAPGTRRMPAVATAANGHFVVVWQEGDSSAAPTEPVVVKARLFDATGKPRSTEIQVARHVPVLYAYDRLSVAMAPDGRFVVVWAGGKENPKLVFGRRYAADGRPLGPRFPLSKNLAGQESPDVAMAADGSFVAVWAQKVELDDPTDPNEVAVDVFFRRFGSDGRPLGPEAVAIGGYEEQSEARVALRPDGGFVVACQNWNEQYDILARLFSGSGAPLGDEFQVNEGPLEDATQFGVAVAVAPDGRLAFAWSDRSGDIGRAPSLSSEDYTGVAIRFYAADGTPLGPERAVNVFLLGTQASAAVSALQTGGFLMLWTSGADQDGDGTGIFGRVFGADGSPRGREFRINLQRTGSQVAPALSVAPNGKGAAVWYGPDKDGSGIFGRLIGPP